MSSTLQRPIVFATRESRLAMWQAVNVYSLKDVPMDMLEGFELACVSEHEDPRGAWVQISLVTAQLPWQVNDLQQAEALGDRVAADLKRGGAH